MKQSPFLLSAFLLLLVLPEGLSAQVLRENLWVTDGPVLTVAAANRVVYIGGAFSRVGPATGGFVALDTGTGALLPPVLRVTGDVVAAVQDGEGGWYIGGIFISVGGQARRNLAHIDSAGIPTSWNPAPNGGVHDLLLSGGTLYVCGGFTSIGGVARNHIAALPTDSSGVTPWDPNANGQVLTLAIWQQPLFPFTVTLYAGGMFTSIGGQARSGLAALDVNTGQATSWDPDIGGHVYCLKLVQKSNHRGLKAVYAGGSFSTIGDRTRHNLGAIDPVTGGATVWNPAPDNLVNAIMFVGPTLYAGGLFRSIGGVEHDYIAAIDTAGAGGATGWDPHANGMVTALASNGGTVYAGGFFHAIGGQERVYLAALDGGTGSATGWNPVINDAVGLLVTDGSKIYAGGNFTSVGGVERQFLAALDSVTGEATDWNPSANNAVHTLVVAGTTIYAGGEFDTIGGERRLRVAALSPATGNATSWSAADIDGYVNSIATGHSTLFIGGDFNQVGGQTRNFLAGLDSATGAVTMWDPDADGIVRAITLSGSSVYAAGEFDDIGGQLHPRIASLDAGTGAALSWNTATEGHTVNTLAVQRLLAIPAPTITVYAGGHFSLIGGSFRNSIAAVNGLSGDATDWNPDAPGNEVDAIALKQANSRGAISAVYAGGNFESIGGEPATGLACLDPSTGGPTTWHPQLNGQILALVLSGNTLYAGGDFNSIADRPHQGIASFLLTVSSARQVSASWNLVSTPVKPQDSSVSALFPNAGGKAFTYTHGAYVSSTTVRHGIGYWLKFPSASASSIEGVEMTTDTVAVSRGWNLIGSISTTVAAASIVTDPPGISSGPFYGYTNAYTVADSIQPGGAYWVRVNQDGKLILSSSASASPAAALRIVASNELPPPAPESDLLPGASPGPREYALGQNYPNPFNPVTDFTWQIAQGGWVTLNIIDVLGREVKTLVNEREEAGGYHAAWDARAYPSGVYFYRLKAGSFTDVKKLLLLR